MQTPNFARNRFRPALRTNNAQDIELRVYAGFAVPRAPGSSGPTLPAYQAHNIKAIVVPIQDSALSRDNAGRAGRTDQNQQAGGKRVKSTVNFIISRQDVSLDETSLSDGLIKLVYRNETWEVLSLKIYPNIIQLTAATEFE